MKNSYLINGKKVIDSIKGKKRALYLITEDNEKYFARTAIVQIKCSKCNKYSSPKHFNINREKKDYVCSHCAVKGENNPFYGKKHSDEFKKKLSKERKGKWYIGEKNPMYGKRLKDFMTPEEYEQWKKNIIFAQQNMSDEKKKLRFERASLAQKKCKERNPAYYRQIKSKAGHITMSKWTRYKKTKPEQLLEQFLIENNVNYDYSCIMGSGDKCFQYDFIIHDKRILIEVQGNYWHGDPAIYNEDGSNGKKKLNNVQKEKIKRDVLKKEFAEDKKFKLICIWESEIKNKDFSKLKEIL